MKKRVLSALLCLVMVLSFLPVTAGAATTIHSISLTLSYPNAGQTPSDTATCNGSGYRVAAMDWLDRHEDRYLEAGDKIQAGHSYEVTVWVEASSGYEFNCTNDNTPNVSATVNGAAASVTKAYEYKAWAMVNVTYYINNVPEKGWLKSVSLSIPAPEAGEAPYYGPVSTSQYSLGNVSMSGSSNPNRKNGILWRRASDQEPIAPDSGAVYAEETAYTFQCMIIPAEGYRFTENATVKINGSSAKVSLDYDHFLSVSFDFPKTESIHVHSPSDWRITQPYHYKVCTTCGEFLEQEDHYGGTATCGEKATCAACGCAYGETTGQHTPSDWRITQPYHYKACTTCGEFLEQEDHYGGTATCGDPAICAACGTAYGEPTEQHSFASKWTAQGAMGHMHVCTVCQTFSDLEAHVPGPEATEDSPQLCTVCGFILAPAKGHIHQLTKVEAVEVSCTEEGCGEYYACSGCTELFSDAAGSQKLADRSQLTIPPLGHVASEDFQMDGQYHWRSCTRCGEALAETTQLHEDTDNDGKCDTCACGIATDISTTPTEAPTTPETQTPPAETQPEPEKEPENKLPLVLLTAGVCAAASVAGVFLAITLKKGKKA